MSAPALPVVLVVQDESAASETTAQIPGDRYEIRTATNISDAFVQLDDISAVLIDRALSAADADDVLATLRDHGVDSPAAILTEHTPDFDVVETGFDDYVTKPLTQDALCETLGDLIARGEYARKVQEYHDLLSKQTAMKEERAKADLATCDEYLSLEARIDDLQMELEAANDRFLDDAEFVGTLRDLAGDSDTTEGRDD